MHKASSPKRALWFYSMPINLAWMSKQTIIYPNNTMIHEHFVWDFLETRQSLSMPHFCKCSLSSVPSIQSTNQGFGSCDSQPLIFLCWQQWLHSGYGRQLTLWPFGDRTQPSQFKLNVKYRGRLRLHSFTKVVLLGVTSDYRVPQPPLLTIKMALDANSS